MILRRRIKRFIYGRTEQTKRPCCGAGAIVFVPKGRDAFAPAPPPTGRGHFSTPWPGGFGPWAFFEVSMGD